MSAAILHPKQNKKSKKVAVIGGGTGSFVVLSGLRDYNLKLTSLVTMMDSGGSTGRLRDQLGVLPPGDLRQALVAMSKSPEVWRELFVYRFDAGELDGHSFGNLFISALEKITGSIEEAVRLAGEVLRTKGAVLPITFDKAELCVRLEDGTMILGEAFIDVAEPNRPRIVKTFLSDTVSPNPNALKAISEANVIIFGPGDLYTSILPNLLVPGVAKAIKKSKAKKVYICNLMTKLGQTDGYTGREHLQVLKTTGDIELDYVFVNSKVPPKKVLGWYERYDADKVSDDFGDGSGDGSENAVTVVRADLLSRVVYEKSTADRVKRSLIRHDPVKLARAIAKTFDFEIAR